MDVTKGVLDSLKDAQSVLILIHQKPDGDAIGSAIAMGRGLKQLGKDVDYYVDENIEAKVNFFDEIKEFNPELKDHYDVLLTLDCSTLDYAKSPEEMPAYDKLVVIDHHLSNKKYGDENYVYETGATAELVYKTLMALGAELDDQMREALFTGISTDTGSFQFSNANDETFLIASKLHEGGYNFAPISKRLHAQKTLEQMQLYGKAIDSLELFDDGKIAILTMPYDVIQQYGGISNVTDDITNIGMNIDTTRLSAFIKETEPGFYRISLRSKSPFNLDVSPIALELGGGGHFRAAGGEYTGSLEDIKKFILEKYRKLLETLDE